LAPVEVWFNTHPITTHSTGLKLVALRHDAGTEESSNLPFECHRLYLIFPLFICTVKFCGLRSFDRLACIKPGLASKSARFQHIPHENARKRIVQKALIQNILLASDRRQGRISAMAAVTGGRRRAQQKGSVVG
jgi:hypothetical protein